MTELYETEKLLCQAYAEELEVYTETLAQLEKAAEPGSDPGYGQDWVTILDEGMSRIGPIESRISAEKMVWGQSGAKAGPELSSLVDRLGSKIQELKGAIERGADSLQHRKDLLRPEFDQAVRLQQTRRAYQDAR